MTSVTARSMDGCVMCQITLLSFSDYLHPYTWTPRMCLSHEAIANEINITLSNCVVEFKIESSYKSGECHVYLSVGESFTQTWSDDCDLRQHRLNLEVVEI